MQSAIICLLASVLANLANPGTAFAAGSCVKQKEAPFGGIEDLAAIADNAVRSSSDSCDSRRLTARDKKELQALDLELKKLPPSPSRELVSKLVSHHQKRLSPFALHLAIARAEQEKFNRIEQALRTSPSFAQAYLALNQTSQTYRSEAQKVLCGIECREKNLRAIEKARDALLASLKETSVPADLQRELKKSIYAKMSAIYRENSERAQVSAARAALGENFSRAVKDEVLSTGWFALSLLWMGRTAGLASTSLMSAGASMEKLFTETALKTLSHTAAGAAVGGGVFGSVEAGKILGRALGGGSPDASFFCRLAKEIHSQGPRAIQNTLTGAALGGVLGAFTAGVRTNVPSLGGRIAEKPLPSEVKRHLDARARMLGKKESIAPAAGVALAAHAAVGGAVIGLSKETPKGKPREVIQVDLRELPLPPPPAAPNRAEAVQKKPERERPQKTKPAKAKTADAAPERIPVTKPLALTQKVEQVTGPAGQSTARSSAPVAPETNGEAPGFGLFKGKGSGKSEGGTTGLNLLPSSRKLAEQEDAYRERFRSKVRQGEANFYNPDDLQLGSFQRRVIQELYSIWKYPDTSAKGVTPVEITFGRDGAVKDARLLESSGTALLDEEVLRAVHALGPHGALPKSYSKDEYRLILFFKYGATDTGEPKGTLR